MSYSLGVDVGTTYTAAAISTQGRSEVVTLGNRSAVIPTVVYLREPDGLLVGDAANRRAVTDPAAVAREFKRRVGDPTPILLAGSPMSAQALMARTLRWVVDQVIAQEGGSPATITATHPANWGPYKLDLFHQAIQLADLGDTQMLAEPVAAAAHYASHARLATGAAVAVYDLGGGTFDAAVVRRAGAGFELLGVPEGIEHLGGIDLDEAVFAAVTAQLSAGFASLDPDDANAVAAVARLRQECVDAKEALSTETAVTVPVLLPQLQTQVEVTRDQIEQMVRPALGDTIGALQRAIDAAGLSAGDLSAVLLVGGSSRIPLVAQMVTEALGRPVAVDTHPKHAVALGAARVGENGATDATVVSMPRGVAPVAPVAVAGRPVGMSLDAEPTELIDVANDGGVLGDRPGPPPDGGVGDPQAASDDPTERDLVAIGRTGPGHTARGRRGRYVAVVLVALMALGGLGLANLVGGGGDELEFAIDPGDDPADVTGDEAPEVAADPIVEEDQEPDPIGDASAGDQDDDADETEEPDEPAEPAPPPAACDGGLCIQIDDVTVDGGDLLITWTADGFVPDTAATHAHFYWGIYDAAQVGTNATDRAPWELTDAQPFVPGGEMQLVNRPDGADTVCVTAADGEHAVIEPANHSCFPIPADA